MHVVSKINNIRNLKKISLDELSQKIGMTKNGLHLAFKSNDLKLSIVYKIADVLEVPVSYFFEETKSNQANDIEGVYKKKCKDCEEKQQIIELQAKYITSLETQITLLNEQKGK